MNHEATELKLFIENDADLYRQQTTPIIKNLTAKKASGKYNRDLAVKLFMYLAEAGAKKYEKEFMTPGTWHKVFTPAIRKEICIEWRDEFEEEFKNGSYDEFIPKKYQKAKISWKVGDLVGFKGTDNTARVTAIEGDHLKLKNPNGETDVVNASSSYLIKKRG